MYLAIKRGKQPKFSKLTMISSSADDEALLSAFIQSGSAGAEQGETVSEYRAAPQSIIASMGGCPSGLLMDIAKATVITNSAEDTNALASLDLNIGSPGGERNEEFALGDEAFTQDNMSQMMSPSGNFEMGYDGTEGQERFSLSEHGGDAYDEEESIQYLTDRLAELESERDDLIVVNNDLHKKCCALLAREKLLEGGKKSSGEDTANTATTDLELLSEQLMEKEKQFRDNLHIIQEARNKLERQHAEFDQLALDLQTRLDDKEFKAAEISESFKIFKRLCYIDD